MSDESKTQGVSRRGFLGLVAASVAATAPGCRRAIRERIVPYVRQPESVRPGQPTPYATSMVLDGYARGLLVQCVDGRPIKVEGNPGHPASLGATGPLEQASVLQLYDPDRATQVTLRGGAASWQGLRPLLADLRHDGGQGLRILMPPTSSPFVADLIARVEQAYPAARFVFSSSVGTTDGWAGGEFGQGHPRLELVHDFGAADTVVSLDADFLGRGAFALRYARQWASRRDPETAMSRLYCAETAMSLTGSMADERSALPPSQLAPVALKLAAEVRGLVPGHEGAVALATVLGQWRRRPEDAWIGAAARDLVRSKGKGIVVVGQRQPAAVQALGHLVNQWLGNVGKTVDAVPCGLARARQPLALPDLAAELGRGQVKTLLVLGGNPAYEAPADLDFGRLLGLPATSVYLGPYANETARSCHWLVPAAHQLESWGDARALDGTVSFLQPTIAGLHDARSEGEMLLALLGGGENLGEALRTFWREHGRAPAFGDAWQEWLRAGMVADTAFAPTAIDVDQGAVAEALARLPPPSDGLELNLLPDPAVHDGSFANNAWLAELPRPVTHLCWGNAALVSPQTAKTMGRESGDVVELRVGDRTLRAPLWIAAGHAAQSVTLHLGHGREGAERIARHVGVDAGRLRTVAMPWFGGGLEVRPTEDKQPMALFQTEDHMYDRPIALRATHDEYRRDPERFAHHRGAQSTLYRRYDFVGEQWAMSIDLGLCIGCGACVIACQAENNIPVVGAREVRRGRLMHWLRIDSYVTGPDQASVIHQPLPCQQCEMAPCEYVCPVNATVHSADGLNDMVYNRCVGTRFCSNNCPYKVRRFNWFNWHDHQAANQGSVRLQRNPQVTVRDRGVMEKCTYCVQRIRRAEFAARIEDRAIRPGEVMTACQQACPTGAIAFASLSHAGTPAVERRKSKRAYELLHNQGTRPRTWYLARIDNPNPELA